MNYLEKKAEAHEYIIEKTALFGSGVPLRKNIQRGVSEFGISLTGKRVRALKKERKALKSELEAAKKMNFKAPKEIDMNSVDKLKNLISERDALLKNNVDSFKQHGDAETFDKARKEIMDKYNKKIKDAGLDKVNLKDADFARRTVNQANYNNKNTVKQINVNDLERQLKDNKTQLKMRKSETRTSRGLVGLGALTYGSALNSKMDDMDYRRNRRDLTRLQLKEMRDKQKQY